VVELPIEAGNLGGLRCVEGKLLFVRRLPPGAAEAANRPAGCCSSI
jgi:hypothetical protein